MSTEIIKKLRLADRSRALILNAPDGYIDNLRLLIEDVPLTKEQQGNEGYDFVQLFVNNIDEWSQWIGSAARAVVRDGLFWICYPKGTSKVKSDLNRDILWQHMSPHHFTGISLVSLDDTWSAMRFRPSDLVPADSRARAEQRQAAQGSSVSQSKSADKTVTVPGDLATAFQANPEAAAFYEGLAYSHRKEYVRWITDAKRAETRQGRIEKTLDKLSRGIKKSNYKRIAANSK
ncbi:YdeI/OmpD-associated family protein [Paenibacillus hexagrammi]|uniref:YdeI/OmpD-associated family protein n=1 Tax=Paenibacillus hexagrammi TaxID=2908839 RepID=A0ABY3SFR5_9BACL|nr:YdeI/OmpD-associated family protein [Paenibacillus sp. YPD9-1]UJF31930.1 YdeI/OmpD-associated family protein [Paenibacillus sp. YPD9-1]